MTLSAVVYIYSDLCPESLLVLFFCLRACLVEVVCVVVSISRDLTTLLLFRRPQQQALRLAALGLVQAALAKRARPRPTLLRSVSRTSFLRRACKKSWKVQAWSVKSWRVHGTVCLCLIFVWIASLIASLLKRISL